MSEADLIERKEWVAGRTFIAAAYGVPGAYRGIVSALGQIGTEASVIKRREADIARLMQ